MKAGLVGTACAMCALGLLSVSLLFSQESAVDDIVEEINLRLSHSSIEGIDKDGVVTIKSPDEIYKFNLRDASFNYNSRNDDSRVRILCNYCIEQFDDHHLEDTIHRESFLCKSEKHALQVIDDFKRLKRMFADRGMAPAPFDKPLSIGSSSLPYATVREAVDYINGFLDYSMILRVDENGRMLINAPSNIYEVDLRKAQFGFNDLADEPRVRIYGEWCVEQLDKGHNTTLPRESFQISDEDDAGDIMRALYFIKAAYTGVDAASVNSLKAVTGAKTNAYSTVAEAIDYINDRLKYSLIQGVSDKGVVTINSQEYIFVFDIAQCTFSPDHADSILKEMFSFGDGDSFRKAILVTAREGIERYREGRLRDTIDDQDFQCRSQAEATEVIKAFGFVRDKIRGGKGR